MAYDFSSLSRSEFEDLARDLIGSEIGKRFEAFPEGPDGGMDGRHALADGAIVLLAKHMLDNANLKDVDVVAHACAMYGVSLCRECRTLTVDRASVRYKSLRMIGHFEG